MILIIHNLRLSYTKSAWCPQSCQSRFTARTDIGRISYFIHWHNPFFHYKRAYCPLV